MKTEDRGQLWQATLQLFLISFSLLFQELVLIRWVGQQIRVLAYFPNIILISSFLGLGIGCLRSGKKDLFDAWPTALTVVVLVTGVLSRVVFTNRSPSEHLWLLYYDLGPNAPVVHSIDVPIAAIFLFSTLSFVSLGQALANQLTECRRLKSPLWGL